YTLEIFCFKGKNSTVAVLSKKKQMKNEVEIQKYPMRETNKQKHIFEESARTAGIVVCYDNFRFWQICKPMGQDIGVAYPNIPAKALRIYLRNVSVL
ncbi:hypothetical protein PV326_014357, partial [Microctonus aethiopoides]